MNDIIVERLKYTLQCCELHSTSCAVGFPTLDTSEHIRYITSIGCELPPPQPNMVSHKRALWQKCFPEITSLTCTSRKRAEYGLESTVSNTELSEFVCLTEVRGESSVSSSQPICAKANSPSFSQNSPSLPQSSVSSLFRNSALETVFPPLPNLLKFFLADL